MADGAMCVGTATDGCVTPDHATGRTVLVATDGTALGGAAGTAIVGPAVGDWNSSIGFTVPGCRRLAWRLCGKVACTPCRVLVSSMSRSCSCWRRCSSRANLALSSTILWTSSYSPILVASNFVTLAAALTADIGVSKTLPCGSVTAASGATLDPDSAGATPGGVSLFATPEAATPGVTAADAATPDASSAACSAASGGVGDRKSVV